MRYMFVRSFLRNTSCQLCGGFSSSRLGQNEVPVIKFVEYRRVSSVKTKPERTAIFQNNESNTSVPEDIVRKIKYNSILSASAHLSWNRKKRLETKEKRAKLADRSLDVPLSLKYVTTSDTEPKSPVFPFGDTGNKDSFTQNDSRKTSSSVGGNVANDQLKTWMNSYEYFSGATDVESHDHEREQLSYGTPDCSVPVSIIPCGGCGAYLQCQDTAIPGYLPSELLKYRADAELRAMKCQRCHFLENYNIALGLSVQPDAYSVLMQHIKKKRALCIVVVDITDFPCSLWPGIVDIIGPKRPVVVVGNKIDLLPSDRPNFLPFVKKWLEEAVAQSELAATHVKHVALVSAKTGFGIEQLITKLQLLWKPDGDVYLLGCTNAGKSTLFNALVRSDYCKVLAVDLMQRATTSEWPGTTLHLLKFPIHRSKPYLLYERMRRLQTLRSLQKAEEELKRDQLKVSGDPLDATFIGHIGFTLRDTSKMTGAGDPFSMKPSATVQVKPKLGLDPEEKHFHESKWCYDTPGAVHPSQILHLLTAEELLLTLPRHMLIPRTYLLCPGDTLLVAGLARLDFLSQNDCEPGHTRFTVFAAAALPITVCCTEHVDEVYSSLAAANMLRVPCGDKERLAQWPSLKAYPDTFQVKGVHSGESAADVMLSSAGWVAVTPSKEKSCSLRAWTPHGKGILLRVPSLISFAVGLRGSLVRKTPAYHQGRAVRL